MIEQSQIEVKRAYMEHFANVVSGLDSILSKEGFGFVNKMQIRTEISRGTVFIAYINNEEAGYRVGKQRLWNIAVYPRFRGMGVGKALVDHYRPTIIRVKNDPIGHLSKEQKDNFTDPTAFYETMGFMKIGTDYGRNFFQRGGGKAHYHKKGKQRHISIYVDEYSYLFQEEI